MAWGGWGRMGGGVGWRAGLALIALTAVGCDTVAEISFTQRQLQGAATNGTLNANACTDTDNQFRFTFVVFDGDDILISPGEVVNNEQIVIEGAGANFDAQDVTFQNPILYPSPDQPCSGDGDCSGPFTCQPINPFNSGSTTICGMPVAVDTRQEPVTFDEGSDEKTIAFVIDSSATIAGRTTTNQFEPTCATDRSDQRLAGVTGLLLKYANSGFRDDTSVCIAHFSGTGPLGGEDTVTFVPTPQNCLSPIADEDELDTVTGRVRSLSQLEDGLSAVWFAVTDTIEQQLADADGDRILILFTDGPDDGSVTVGFEDAVATALANDVTVHVIHLDTTPAGQNCRVVESAEGDMDQFAQIACETGGSYQYATGPNDLRSLFENLALTVPASYEVQAQLVALLDEDLPDDIHAYRLSTGVEFDLAGRTITIQRAGDKTDPVTTNVIDDRLILFRRPVPPPPEGTGS